MASAKFSPDQFDIIHEAAGAWNGALGREALVVHPSADVEIPAWDGLSVIHTSDVVGGSTSHIAGYGADGWIRIDTDVALWEGLDGAPLYNVALHEFGHVLGLDHSAPGTAMGYVLKLGQDRKPLLAEKQRITMDDAIGAW